MNEPWYHTGLRFECTRCGDCCTGAPGHVWVNEDEVGAIARLQNMPVHEVLARATRLVGERRSLREAPNGDCVFFERGRGCTVYSVRPRQCRTWPFWESNVATPEAWEKTCEICPGSGCGNLIPAEEITRRLGIIRI